MRTAASSVLKLTSSTRTQWPKAHDYFDLGDFRDQSDNNLCAYSVDTVSRRQYVLRSCYLRTGAELPDASPTRRWRVRGRTTAFFLQSQEQAYYVTTRYSGTRLAPMRAKMWKYSMRRTARSVAMLVARPKLIFRDDHNGQYAQYGGRVVFCWLKNRTRFTVFLPRENEHVISATRGR
ncbi:MAG: hypothetical protein IPP33_16650 [Flavobacteriales bacterium]|nr:hypothetical protein [Flavobacteriales bacterium]